jgi:phosphopantetheine adenylyltransferase
VSDAGNATGVNGDSQRIRNQISGTIAPAAPATNSSTVTRARRPGTLVDELVARLAPTGLPSDVQHVVNVAVRSGMGESDPNWIWLLPVLLRQVSTAAMRIEFEALSAALLKSAPRTVQGTGHDEDNLEAMVTMMTATRTELQKLHRRIGDTLKPAVTEAVVDALESAPNRMKVELDDSRLHAAAREAFVTPYVLAAIGFGAFATMAAFIIGSKFG